MAEESSTPDLVELALRAAESGARGDLDAVMSLFADDAVWDLAAAGLGTFAGSAAIRGFLEDWGGSFEDLEI